MMNAVTTFIKMKRQKSPGKETGGRMVKWVMLCYRRVNRTDSEVLGSEQSRLLRYSLWEIQMMTHGRRGEKEYNEG